MDYLIRLPERFLCKFVRIEDGCWIWSAAKNHDGYGRFSYGRKSRLAHRFSYEAKNGTIPVGMELDHLCKNRSCVNPEHLELVTHSENVKRGNVGYRKHWTSCINGHPFDDKNTYIVKSSGKRKCRICNAATQKRFRERIANAI